MKTSHCIASLPALAAAFFFTLVIAIAPALSAQTGKITPAPKPALPKTTPAKNLPTAKGAAEKIKPTITSVTAQVDGWAHYRPDANTVEYMFSGKITTNGPCAISYRWKRSDNTGGATETLNAPGAGTYTVRTMWPLGYVNAGKSFSETLEILSPDPMTSNQATFTATAQPLKVTSVTAQAGEPALTQSTGMLRYGLNGKITFTGKGAVTYRWYNTAGTFSTGTLSVNVTAGSSYNLPPAYWQVPLSETGKQYGFILEVLEPTAIKSSPATITVPNASTFDPFKVQSASVTATAVNLTGMAFLTTTKVPCVVKGSLAVSGTGAVRYRWTYSDGTSGPEKTVISTKTGNYPVEDGTRQVARTGQLQTVWAALETRSPNVLTSGRANFIIPAMPAQPKVTAVTVSYTSMTPASATSPNASYSFAGKITTDGAMTVKYRWRYGDGTSSGEKTMNPGKAGTHYTENGGMWKRPNTPDANVWAMIEVTSPTAMASAKVTPSGASSGGSSGAQTGVEIVNFLKAKETDNYYAMNGWRFLAGPPGGAKITSVKNTSNYAITLSEVKSDASQNPTRHYLANTVNLAKGASTNVFNNRTGAISWWSTGPLVDNPPEGRPRIEISWSK